MSRRRERFVVAAAPDAVAQARSLGFRGDSVEAAVRAALGGGRVQPADEERLVAIGDSLLARIAVQEGCAWGGRIRVLVTRVEPASQFNHYNGKRRR